MATILTSELGWGCSSSIT